MNIKQWLGLNPEEHHWEAFVANAGVVFLDPLGEVGFNLCDDPGKTISMVELAGKPSQNNPAVFLHLSGVRMVGVIQGVQVQDQTVTLDYHPSMRNLVRARGCQVYVGDPGFDFEALQKALKLLFP
ncbi:hypothetical protein [Deinococcus roseus]|uniref:Uncharacterized protein n=1 Tax=Deinococcus roseus TaxID=392414 RepID=A0ABQ2D2D2_9DEIO|nr:hypothetical protein [Deinococcus roseus]GGJ43104.1 hypothetical protein GCM10008938_31680 [Deinococcus roseus]